jgi:hypothetical protein
MGLGYRDPNALNEQVKAGASADVTRCRICMPPVTHQFPSIDEKITRSRTWRRGQHAVRVSYV